MLDLTKIPKDKRLEVVEKLQFSQKKIVPMIID
jgi:hypothetical protein